MFRLLSRWLRHKPDRNGSVAQLEQLRNDLDVDPTSFPLDDLRPALIPSPILETGRWVGPYHYFPDLPVSLTWAFLRPQQTMMYLSTAAADAFDSKGIDWRTTARLALAREFDTHPWTHEFHNERGDLEAVVLLHDDGLGPSRLIMYRRLAQQFPTGFIVFVPERSCALVMSAKASAEVRDSVEKAVHRCFTGAEVPMSERGYDHTLLREALDRVGECA